MGCLALRRWSRDFFHFGILLFCTTLLTSFNKKKRNAACLSLIFLKSLLDMRKQSGRQKLALRAAVYSEMAMMNR